MEVNGFTIRVERVEDAVALLRALSEQPAMPAKVEKPLSDSLPVSGPPPAREPRTRRDPPKLREPHVTGVGGGRIGRKPTWTDDELVQLHARLKAGERIEDLAAERGKVGRALYQAFGRKGLPVKFARPNPVQYEVIDPDPEVSNIRIDRSEVPVRRLAPGESRVENSKGEYVKAGA